MKLKYEGSKIQGRLTCEQTTIQQEKKRVKLLLESSKAPKKVMKHESVAHAIPLGEQNNSETYSASLGSSFSPKSLFTGSIRTR